MRLGSQTVPETLEVPIKVKDADACGLGGDGDSQVGEGKAMGAMGATGSQLAHRCENGPLHATVHRYLAKPL